MIYIARGKQATVHYAICTGIMGQGMMLPGMWDGWRQPGLGYLRFFIRVIRATIPSFLIVMRVPLDYDFGKRSAPA
jgi:MFS transporter, PAT family, beta-lactamase induction signal transducer AmpG